MRFLFLALSASLFLNSAMLASQTMTVTPRVNRAPSSAPIALPSLEVDWDAIYDFGILGADGFSATATDSLGNIYAVGNSLGGGGSRYSYEVLTTKFDASGNLIWARRYDSPGNGFNDVAVDLAIDSDNSVIVLGTGPTLSGDQDVLLFRYDSAGNLLWQTIWSNNWSDGASNVEVAPDGSIYVLAASYYGVGQYTNTVLLKFDAQGSLLWDRPFDGHGGTENAVLMQIGPMGNIYVGGTTIHTAGTVDFDWLGLKYDPAGNLLWVFERGGLIQWPDYVNDMAITLDGSMVLVGYIVNQLSGSSGVPSFTTMKVDTNGNFLWQAVESTSQERANTVTTDAAGNVYVAGSSVRSYTPDGQWRWTKVFRDSAFRQGTARAIQLDQHGNLFLSGSIFGGSSGNDYLLHQINPQSGAMLDEMVYGDSLDKYFPIGSGSRMMTFGPGKSLYLAGSTFNGHESDALLVRFTY